MIVFPLVRPRHSHHQESGHIKVVRAGSVPFQAIPGVLVPVLHTGHVAPGVGSAARETTVETLPAQTAAKDVDANAGDLRREPPFPGMVWIPGGTFLMGSDKHYPEERPAHRVTVDGFWIDRTPVTNERFARFVDATAHTTFAEIPPNPADYPGALPEMIYAGSLVFVKP
jgi:formylglycine-generating enzyme required for sulfatase activity